MDHGAGNRAERFTGEEIETMRGQNQGLPYVNRTEPTFWTPNELTPLRIAVHHFPNSDHHTPKPLSKPPPPAAA